MADPGAPPSPPPRHAALPGTPPAPPTPPPPQTPPSASMGMRATGPQPPALRTPRTPLATPRTLASASHASPDASTEATLGRYSTANASPSYALSTSFGPALETDSQASSDGGAGAGAAARGAPAAPQLPWRPLLVPPINFAMVMPGVYRSGYPNARNHSFLTRLNVRTVLMCAADEYASNKFGRSNLDYCAKRGVRIVRCRMEAHKEPFGTIKESVVAEAVEVLLDARNHPVLVHDDKGRHRCGVIVACLRKVQGWSLASILEEYAMFAQDPRLLDMQWIELFSHPVRIHPDFAPSWIALEDALFP